MRHDIELTVQRTERHTQCCADSNSGSGRYFGFFIELIRHCGLRTIWNSE
jgi:hypothetical protein